jgi:hypothetical protein
VTRVADARPEVEDMAGVDGTASADDTTGATGLFVYGVMAADAELPAGLAGVDDAPVRLVAHGRVAAAVGEVVLERPPGRKRELLAYSRTLDALAGTDAVIPVQFGSILADERSVAEDLLAPDEEYFSEYLAQLAGRAQFTLRADYLEEVVLSEVVAADPEIAALRNRTRDLPEEAAYADRVRLGELVAAVVEQKRTVDAELLLDAVLPHVAGHVVRPVGGLTQVLDVALLVDDDRRGEFEDCLETLAEAWHERMRMRLMGPTAAYDFVGGG